MYRLPLFTTILLITLMSAASAQTERPNWTFGGTAGAGRTWDDEGSIGSGWLAGAYLDRRISRRVDLELAVDVLAHDRSSGGIGQSFEAHGHTTYVSAALIRRFGSSRTNCFLLGGGTVGLHRGTAGLSDQPSLNDTDSTDTGFVFGGGLSFRTVRGIELAPVVRMTWMSIDVDSSPASSIMGAVRVGFGR